MSRRVFLKGDREPRRDVKGEGRSSKGFYIIPKTLEIR